MTKQNTNRILFIYNILLSTSIVVAGIFLIYGCINIYYSGNGYSRQLVAQTFSKICIPIYICLGLMVGSFIINSIIPSTHKAKPVKHYNQMLLNLLKTRNTSGYENELRTFDKYKSIFKFSNLFITIVFGIVFFTYAINPKYFHQSDINGSMIKAMLVLLPCLAIPFAFSVFRYYYSIYLTKKQIEILKTLPKKETVDDTTKIKSDGKKVLIVKILIATVAVGVLIFGAATGGFADVLTKAVNICTECIGLG